MRDNNENKTKAFLPYLIIIGAVYLIAPALLFVHSSFVTYIVLIGILPLTALLCCAHYSLKKKSDFALCLIAPLFFGVAMLFYMLFGMEKMDLLRAFIYLIAYLLCGYLGLTIGDILSNKQSASARDARAARPRSEFRAEAASPAERTVRPVSRPAPAPRAARVNVEAASEPVAPRTPAAAPRPRRVDVEAAEAPRRFEAVDPYEDRSLDQSTTSDDIDAILREIHQRRGSE